MEKYLVSIMDEGKETPDYEITVEDTDSGTVYALSTSTAGEWTDHYKGKQLMSITETGDGYKISKKIGKEIDYSEMAELYILLKFINSKNRIYRGNVKRIDAIPCLIL